MALRNRVWSAGKLIVLCGALAATYGIFAAGAMRIVIKAREVVVPDLTDHTTNEATATLTGVGLTLKVDDMQRPDARIAAGRIIAQDPPAGEVARPLRSVRVWLSAGIRSAMVPGVTGETERSATLRLSDEGFTLSDVAEIRTDAYPSDVVVAQDPPALAGGSAVTLLVNRGGRGTAYVMPDLIGVNADQASEILRVRGFRVAVVGSAPYPGVSPGIVLRQRPQAGFQIGPGEAISLEVSQ